MKYLSVPILIIGIIIAYIGCKGVYTYMTNRTPVKMSCADYIKNGTEAKWLELSGCSFHYQNVLVAPKVNLSDENPRFYIPASINPDKPGSIKLLIRENNVKLIKKLEKYIIVASKYINKKVPVENMSDMMLLQWGTKKHTVSIIGLIDDDLKESLTLKTPQGKVPVLSSDYRIIDPQQEPAILWNVVLLVFGLFLSLGYIAHFLS